MSLWLWFRRTVVVSNSRSWTTTTAAEGIPKTIRWVSSNTWWNPSSIHHHHHYYQQQQQHGILHSDNSLVGILQKRFMSKRLSKSATKRLPLTTKRTTKMGFNKGKGCTKEGTLTSKGRFIVDPLKRMQLIVPQNLHLCKLKPYVANVVPKVPPERRNPSSTAAPTTTDGNTKATTATM